jgi:hypothetical protein
MKKFTSLLIGCSLALAGAAWAQQPEEQQQTPAPEKHGAGKKMHAAEAQPGANAANPEATTAKPHGARNAERRGAQGTEATPKSQRHGGKANATGEPETNATGEPSMNATPGGKHQAQQQRGKGKNAHGANAKTSPSVTPATEKTATTGATPATAATAAATSTAPVTAASVGATPATAASASAAPTIAATGQQQTTQANAARGARKRPEPQQVQQIKQQHANFRAQPRPDKVPAVTFNQNYRIQGSDRWQGPQYEVFRSYHPERHDERWYHSHYNRVELIGGGYYYWNNGYWFPAWGYSPQAEYYAYDGQIYVGHRAEPPDRVIADVQAALQEMGYYRGEVDGLLGPLTREALTAYQADNSLTTTAAIDEPTLDSLGMS